MALLLLIQLLYCQDVNIAIAWCLAASITIAYCGHILTSAQSCDKSVELPRRLARESMAYGLLLAYEYYY